MGASRELFLWIKVSLRASAVRTQSRTIIWQLPGGAGNAASEGPAVSIGESIAAAGPGRDEYVVETRLLDDHAYTRAEAQAWIGLPGNAFAEGALVCSLHSVVVSASGEPPVAPIGRTAS